MTNKIKTFLTIALIYTAYFGSILSCIWIVIEYVRFLLKDDSFNWWSVLSLCACLTTGVLVLAAGLIKTGKQLFIEGEEDDEEIITN